MNHNDNQDFTPQSAGEETAAEVTEETAAKTNENPAAEASAHTEAKAAETPVATPPKSKKGMLGWIIAIIAVAVLAVIAIVLGEPTPEQRFIDCRALFDLVFKE